MLYFKEHCGVYAIYTLNDNPEHFDRYPVPFGSAGLVKVRRCHRAACTFTLEGVRLRFFLCCVAHGIHFWSKKSFYR